MSDDHSIRLSKNWDDVNVLFVDDAMMVLNKPSGLLCVPDRWDRTRENLIGLLIAGIKAQAPWTRRLGISYIANAHRIDCDTSGVFVMSKTREALSALISQFRHRTVTKTYLAMVRGSLPSPNVVCNEPILPDSRRLGLATINAKGRPSTTRFELVESFRGVSLVRAFPETGRLHQVRVHLKALGCPIVADVDYGDGAPLLLSAVKRKYKSSGREERPLLGRMALHAESVRLLHPVTGNPLTIEAPMPRDFKATVTQLRRIALTSFGAQ